MLRSLKSILDVNLLLIVINYAAKKPFIFHEGQLQRTTKNLPKKFENGKMDI